MEFLNPLMLLGMAAAAIPLIIHLFNVRRPRKIDFSSLAFLNELQKTTMQRVRIKQWLLLALRILAVACLVLAFARPTLTGGLAGTLGARGASTVAVVVDNSLSMTLRDAQGEYLEQALDIAAGLIGRLDPNDEIFVLSAAEDPAAAPAGLRSKGAALDALDDIEPQYTSATATDAIRRAAELVRQGSHINKEIYYVTDLQQSTLTDSASLELPEDVRVVVVPVGDRTYGNVGIAEVAVTSRIVEVGQPVRIQATLTNYAGEPVDDYVASVFLNGERVAQASADLPAGGSSTVTFAATPQQRGWLSGAVAIEDDEFGYDNTRYFTLNVPERRNLLVVRGDGQTTRYLELALSPDLTQGRLAFDAQIIPESQLAAANLGTYDAVLLVGPRDLSSGEITALSRYVEAGGGLMFFPNAAAQAGDYNALFQSLDAGEFTGFSGSGSGSGPAVASFERVDLEHPLFDGVFSTPGAIVAQTRVESPDVYRAMNYTPGPAGEQTLIQLSNGFPFLQEVRYGNGIVFLMSVAPDIQWSDLPTRGLFIPLLYRSVFYLSAGGSAAGDPLLVGQPGELRVAGVSAQQQVRLVSPNGEEYIPDQRSLFGTALLTIDAPVRAPGVYEVRAGDALLRRVAFNLDSRESDLRAFGPEQAEEVLGEQIEGDVHVSPVPNAGAERVVQALSERRYGVEIWNVFLLFALIFLVAEMLVARQWRPETVTA